MYTEPFAAVERSKSRCPDADGRMAVTNVFWYGYDSNVLVLDCVPFVPLVFLMELTDVSVVSVEAATSVNRAGPCAPVVPVGPVEPV